MTPKNHFHSTSSRHRSLISSQSYDSAIRRSVTAFSHTPNSLASKQRRGLSRSASSSSKPREERDNYYPTTPKGSGTVKQTPKTTGKRTNSKYEYSDEFFEKLNTPVIANASMQHKSKDHSRKARKVEYPSNSICVYRRISFQS